jgi:2TM domain
MSTYHPAGVTPEDDEADLRQLAVEQLRKKRDLQAHLIAYLLVNAFLNAIWLLTNAGGFYWPMFPLFGWGIGVAFHVWDVYAPAEPAESRIQREMKHLGRR